MLVAGAAADIAGDDLADFRFIGIRMTLQERHQSHNETGCTEAALQTMGFHEAFLDRMQVLRCS